MLPLGQSVFHHLLDVIAAGATSFEMLLNLRGGAGVERARNIRFSQVEYTATDNAAVSRLTPPLDSVHEIAGEGKQDDPGRRGRSSLERLRASPASQALPQIGNLSAAGPPLLFDRWILSHFDYLTPQPRLRSRDRSAVTYQAVSTIGESNSVTIYTNPFLAESAGTRRGERSPLGRMRRNGRRRNIDARGQPVQLLESDLAAADDERALGLQFPQHHRHRFPRTTDNACEILVRQSNSQHGPFGGRTAILLSQFQQEVHEPFAIRAEQQRFQSPFNTLPPQPTSPTSVALRESRTAS